MHSPHGVEDDYSISRDQHDHSSSDECEEDIGSSPIDYSPLERLQRGSRVSTEAIACEAILCPEPGAGGPSGGGAHKGAEGSSLTSVGELAMHYFQVYQGGMHTCSPPSFYPPYTYSAAKGGGGGRYYVHGSLGNPSHLRRVLQDLPDFSTQPQGRPRGRPTAASKASRIKKNGNWTDEQLKATLAAHDDQGCHTGRPEAFWRAGGRAGGPVHYALYEPGGVL
jgi:hypothetical protein